MFQILKFLPAHIGPIEGELFGMGIIGIGVGVLMFVPFLDRGASEGKVNRWWTLFGIFALVFFAVFTVLGYVLD